MNRIRFYSEQDQKKQPKHWAKKQNQRILILLYKNIMIKDYKKQVLFFFSATCFYICNVIEYKLGDQFTILSILKANCLFYMYHLLNIK